MSEKKAPKIKAKVIRPRGVNHNGQTYAKDAEIMLDQGQFEDWAAVGIVEAVGAESGQVEAAKGDTVRAKAKNEG